MGDEARVVVALAFPHHHGAVDGFPARQEFGFGDDVSFFAGFFPHFHAAAALGFQSGGAFEREGFRDEVVVFIIVGDVFVVDDAREQVVGFIAAAPAGAAFAAAAFRPVIVVFVVFERVGVVGRGWGRRYRGCGE